MDSKQTKLRKIVDDKKEQRERFARLQRELLDRMREIHEALALNYTAFFCETCEADFNGFGTKVVRKQYKKMPIAWYVAFCPERHRCIRRITEKANDPYYVKSFLVRREAARHVLDTIGPDDARFFLLYGHKHKFEGGYKLEDLSGKPPHRPI